MTSILKHYFKIFIASIVLTLIVGVGVTWLIMHERSPEEPALLTVDYIKYNGFKEIAGGGLIFQVNQEVVPGTRDTITSYAAIIPDNRDNPKFYVIGMADVIPGQGYRFIRVDVINKQVEFDRWLEFIKPQEE